jgi:hypothetical protein
MIEESLENHTKLALFLRAAQASPSDIQQFELYQQVVKHLEEETRREEHSAIVSSLLINVPPCRFFEGLLGYCLQKTEAKGHQQLENVLLNFMREQFGQVRDSEGGPSLKNELMAGVLLRNRGGLMPKVVGLCKEQQCFALNFLQAANEAILAQLKAQTLYGMDFTHSVLLALKAVQAAQDLGFSLLEEALRHLLLVDTVQESEISRLISENGALLDSLLLME